MGKEILNSKFLTDLVAIEIKDNLWELHSVLKYQSVLYNGFIEVPAGYCTDFASVPRIPIVYSIFGDRAHRESVIHDFLYQTHLVDRKTADRIFLEAMEVREKSWFIRRSMYLGVRMGGAKSYKTGPERLKILNPLRVRESIAASLSD